MVFSATTATSIQTRTVKKSGQNCAPSTCEKFNWSIFPCKKFTTSNTINAVFNPISSSKPNSAFFHRKKTRKLNFVVQFPWSTSYISFNPPSENYLESRYKVVVIHSSNGNRKRKSLSARQLFPAGFEPKISAWCGRRDLNPGSLAWKAYSLLMMRLGSLKS